MMKWPTENDFGERHFVPRRSSVFSTSLNIDFSSQRQLKGRRRSVVSTTKLATFPKCSEGRIITPLSKANEDTECLKKRQKVDGSEISFKLLQNGGLPSPGLNDEFIREAQAQVYSTPKKQDTARKTFNGKSPDLFTLAYQESPSTSESEEMRMEKSIEIYHTPEKTYLSHLHKRNIWPKQMNKAEEINGLSDVTNSDISRKMNEPLPENDVSERVGSAENACQFGPLISDSSLASTIPLFSQILSSSTPSNKKEHSNSQLKSNFTSNHLTESSEVAEIWPASSLLKEVALQGVRSRSRKVDNVEIVNCESPSDASRKNSSVAVYSPETQSIDNCNEPPIVLSFLISPIKTPPPSKKRSSTVSSIKFSANQEEKEEEEEEEEEEMPRTRRKKLSKLGNALRERIQTTRSDMAMWRCDDSPQQVALRLQLKSFTRQWGVYWLKAKDLLNNADYGVVDSSDLYYSRFSLRREYELNFSQNALEVAVYNPLNIYRDILSNTVLLGPYYFKRALQKNV